MSDQVILCSVGDLMVSDSPLYVSVGFGSSYERVKGHLFETCEEDFNKADIIIGNLESVVHKPRKKSLKEIQMSCDSDVIAEIREAGFNILNFANNHCLQHGTQSFFDTINECEKKQIACIGEKDKDPVVKVVNGIKFYFLSICLYTEFYQPENILYESDITKTINIIKEIRESDNTSIIVLSIHWGDEFAIYPSPTQVELAHLLVDCGTDIILGHHSHTFQGVEKYKGAIILYSQGNFISDMVPALCRDSGIVQLKISLEEWGKDINFRVLPYHIDDNCLPEPSEGEWIEERQAALRKVISHQISDDEYQSMVKTNHKKCHDKFRDRFIHGGKDYNTIIYLQMVNAFAKRKIQKKLGIYPKRFDLDSTLVLAKHMSQGR